jgi:hypothetical protein
MKTPAKEVKTTVAVMRILDSHSGEVVADCVGGLVDGRVVQESLDAGHEGHIYVELRDDGRWHYVAQQHVEAVQREHGADAALYVRRVYVEVAS